MAKTNFDSVQLDNSALYDGDGVQILSNQGAVIAAVTPASDGTATGTALNLVIAELKRHGLIASS